jgi:hypothetical protein
MVTYTERVERHVKDHDACVDRGRGLGPSGVEHCHRALLRDVAMVIGDAMDALSKQCKPTR